MNSAMMNAAAPMIGGMIWPFVDAATSMAPALTAGMPMRRMTGMVKVPVVTTLAMDEPEIMPVMPEARIAPLAGPPLYRPTMAKESARKYRPAPALSSSAPNSTKQEHETDRDADRDAENGLSGQPVIADQPVEAEPLVRDDVGHQLAEDRIDQEDGADDDQRRADRAARGLEQQHDSHAAQDRLDRNAVPDKEHALPRDEAVPSEEQVEGREASQQGAGDIVEGQAPPGPAARHRVDQEAQQQGERQVNAAGGNIADDGEVEHEGEGGGDPELVDRPRETERADRYGKPRPLAGGPGIPRPPGSCRYRQAASPRSDRCFPLPQGCGALRPPACGAMDGQKETAGALSERRPPGARDYFRPFSL